MVTPMLPGPNVQDSPSQTGGATGGGSTPKSRISIARRIIPVIAPAVVVAFVLLMSTYPRANTGAPLPTAAAFPGPDGWVIHHVPTGEITWRGLFEPGPGGRLLAVWQLLHGGRFTVDGHTWSASPGALLGVAMNTHQPDYVGPVYLRQHVDSPWIMITSHH